MCLAINNCDDDEDEDYTPVEEYDDSGDEDGDVIVPNTDDSEVS